MKKYSIALTAITGLLLAVNAFAETTIKAEVDKTSVTTDDFLTYKLTVATTEKDVPVPQPPEFKGFAVVSQAQSSTIVFTQKGPQSNLVFVYVLVAQKTGKITIPPGQIKANGRQYLSEKFEIEVKQGQANPQAPPEQGPASPEQNLPPSKEPQITL